MAVEWRHLIFGDVDSADYGIYISGDGVYNAPERDVEFVSVPGRNGDIAMDQGRYNNITVTYPAGTFAKAQEEFREKLSDFRNAVLSQKGYQRLEDTYHPEEFRMAVYTAGLEVDPVAYQQAGEFELTFNCKPQRWLSVGALPIPVDSGDVLQNPTVFDSGPLIEIEGYGDITFNGFTVSLENAVLGDVLLADSFNEWGEYDPATVSNTASRTISLDKSLFNDGDTITVAPCVFNTGYYTKSTSPHTVDTASASGTDKGSYTSAYIGSSYDTTEINVYLEELTFTAGISSHYNYQLDISFKNRTTNAYLGELRILVTVTYRYTFPDENHFIDFDFRVITTGGIYPPQGAQISAGKTSVYSTLSLLGNPTYIDCDLGEAYRIDNGTPVSLNSKVALGPDLPTLAPGANKITFDDTITDLKIAPRWWKV